MALAGGLRDLYVRQFTDILNHELQQKGSRFRNLVKVENAMGERNYVENRIGEVSSQVRNTRFALKPNMDVNYERRFLTQTTIEFSHILDPMDLDQMNLNPQSAVVEAARMRLQRDMDDLIINAIMGSAQVEKSNDGTVTTVAFDTTNQQIAQNFVGYTDLSSANIELHEGKLLEAKRILSANQVDLDSEEIYVVGNAKQFAYLQSRIARNQGLAYRAQTNEQTVPGLDRGLDGIFGLRFILSERIPQVSSVDNVLVFPKSAACLGIWRDLSVSSNVRPEISENPNDIYAYMRIGAVRLDEKKVVSILCKP